MDARQVLRIVVLVAMGWVVAHSVRGLLAGLGGHVRLPRRAMVGEGLVAIGAFLFGWGLLPGGTADGESLFMLAGSLVWAAGLVVQPSGRAPSGS